MASINDITGKSNLQPILEEGSVHRYELMEEDYVLLKFSIEEPVYLNIGDYAEIEGDRYYLTNPAYPVYNTETGGYDYELKLESHYYLWKNHILFYDRQGNKEASWNLTSAPEVHLGIIVSNLKSLGFTYNGKEYEAVVDSTVSGETKLVQYDNTNIIDALSKIAETWNCEWWVDGDKIYLGRLEYGDPVDLEIGKEIYSMSRSQSQDIYATRLYVFGSTRNIPSDYRKGESGTVVQGVIQKRLMLPEGTPYIDVIDGLKNEQIVEAVVIIEDVYPKFVGTISSISTVERTEGEGEDAETFIAYQFKDENLHFSQQYIMPGETLKLQFQTGILAGMEFELTFNPNGLPEDDPESQVFEIVRNQNYGQWIPKDPLIPEVGNQYILFNFDTQYVSDTLIPEAEQELLEKGLALKDKMVSDPSTYNCVINSYIASGYDEDNGTLNPEKALDLKAGQKVNLKNPAYFKNGRVTRIIGFEKKLDYPYDKPTYTIGETAAYSRLGELEQKIDSIQIEGNTYVNQGGGGANFYVIKKEDPTAASDQNVFSALRTLYEINKFKTDINDMFLRKDINDTAHGIILFDKKIGSSVYLDGWDGKGWEIEETGAAELESLRVRSDIFLKNRLGSDAFISGFPSGYGWDLAPYKRINAAEEEETKYRLEIDDIIVRGKLRVYEMIISQLRGENDNVIFAGMMKVDHYDEATGRIYLDTEEGVLYNPFRPGDILMVQRYGGLPSVDNNYNVIKQYELQVLEAGVGNLEEKENRLDWITFVNFIGELEDIAEGDVLTRVDSVSDSTRKGIAKVTTIDEIGAPYIDVVYGMKTDPENATKVRMGNLSGIRPKSGVDLTGIWGLYANGAYFENSTYILEDGNTIEQEFSIMNGEFRSEIEGIKNDISVESGNILKNSSFSDNLDYWVTDSTVSFFSYDAQFIYANQYFLSEKGDGADIYQDGDKNVLRLKNSYILQRNSVMDFPYHDTELDSYDYSFSFFYKVLSAGRLQVGIENTALYEEVDLSESSSYSKFSKASTWNEQGDFKISFTGEILIYGVSLFTDKLAESIIHLQTQIDQNSEAIKLAATKEYVDKKTGEVYIKYDSQFETTATQISGISTRVDNINNTINTAGWITESEGNTLFASKTLENGNKIISYINQTATTTTINSSRINLRGAVTFSDLNTSLQDMINNPDSEALDKAIEAYNRADDAYTRANSAYTNASTAQSRADSAYSRASTAISDAADALDAANAAQTSVNNLPGWTKEKDIISALEDATVIVNGYIATSMIDVNNLYAKKLNATEGYVGAFKITNYKSLESDDADAIFRMMGASDNFILMSVDTGFVHFQVNSTSGNAIAAVCTSSSYNALYCKGNVKFEGLQTATASTTWKNLLINSSTGEIRRST